MMKYSTYSQAKKDIILLNHFINLVENYEVTDVDSFIIKSYAETSSIAKVIRELNRNKFIYELPINISKSVYISTILKRKPEDALQKIVHDIYKKKVKRKK